MRHYIIAIDQSTSATKALLFDEQCKLVDRCDIAHKQYYPQEGYVEHDAEEIYQNTVEAIRQVVDNCELSIVNCQFFTRFCSNRHLLSLACEVALRKLHSRAMQAAGRHRESSKPRCGPVQEADRRA